MLCDIYGVIFLAGWLTMAASLLYMRWSVNRVVKANEKIPWVIWPKNITEAFFPGSSWLLLRRISVDYCRLCPGRLWHRTFIAGFVTMLVAFGGVMLAGAGILGSCR
jgi:hypothetical protein